MAPPRERRAPQRTCVSCGRQADKGSLLRIAGRPGGKWVPDPEGRKPGRGIYLCPDGECVGSFLRRLRTRKGGERWKMGEGAAVLAAELEAWRASREG